MNDHPDWAKVAAVIDALYYSVDTLQGLFPGRKFTLDGHLVGSLGEVIAACMFDLDLLPASNMGHDATAPDGRQVEIKFTQGISVAIRHEPDHLLTLVRSPGSHVEVVYNGPGAPAWQAAGKMQANGQRSISLARLRQLDGVVHDEERLNQIRQAPV